MTRRNWLLGTTLLAACRKPEPPPNLFTETVAGVWHRTSLSSPSPSDAPDPVPRTSIDRIIGAEYQGPGKIQARLYQLSSPGVALELVQRWRPSADTVFFYQRNYFVVVKWQEADRKALQAFVHELEGRLAPAPARREQ
jgi:hypothetical protein